MSKSKVSKTGAQAAQTWAANLVQSIPNMVNSVNALTVNPCAQAAAAQQKMLTNLTTAVTNGKWAAALNAVDLQTWKKITAQKMAERIPGGAQAAIPTYASAVDKVFSYMNAKLPELAGMPSTTLQDSINKVTAWITYMAGYRK